MIIAFFCPAVNVNLHSIWLEVNRTLDIHCTSPVNVHCSVVQFALIHLMTFINFTLLSMTLKRVKETKLRLSHFHGITLAIRESTQPEIVCARDGWHRIHQILCHCRNDIYKLRNCIKWFKCSSQQQTHCFFSISLSLPSTWIWRKHTKPSASNSREKNGANESFSMLLKLITTDINRMIFCKLLYRVFYCARHLVVSFGSLSCSKQTNERTEKNQGRMGASKTKDIQLIWWTSLENEKWSEKYEEKVLETMVRA